MMRQTSLLYEARATQVTRRAVRRALTLLELLLVLILLGLIGTAALYSSNRFWKTHSLEHSCSRLSQFFMQAEILSILTDSQIEMTFEKCGEDLVVTIKGNFPIKATRSVLETRLQGVDDFNLYLEGEELESPILVYSHSQSYKKVHVVLRSKRLERQVEYRGPLKLRESDSLISTYPDLKEKNLC